MMRAGSRRGLIAFPVPGSAWTLLPERCDELAELLVGDQASLLLAQGLHGREQRRVTILGQIDAQLLALDADRVEPRLLAEDDRAFCPDEVGRVRLDRRRVVELGRDGTGLAAEERLAGERLPRLQLVAGELAHTCAHLAYALELQIRANAVERLERKRDLAEIRIPGALAHAVDRSLHPRRAGLHGCNGRA